MLMSFNVKGLNNLFTFLAAASVKHGCIDDQNLTKIRRGSVDSMCYIFTQSILLENMTGKCSRENAHADIN